MQCLASFGQQLSDGWAVSIKLVILSTDSGSGQSLKWRFYWQGWTNTTDLTWCLPVCHHPPPKLIFKVLHVKFWEKFWLKPLFMPVDRVIGWTSTGLFDFYLLRKLHRRTVSTVLVKFNQQSRLNDQLSIVIANFISSTLLIKLMSALSMFYLLYYNEHI